MAIPLFVIGISSSFTVSLLLAAVSLFSQALSNGGTPVNPNDIAPSHAGMVFGECRVNKEWQNHSILEKRCS